MTENALPTYEHGDYTIGWICALPIESAAARGMLDEKHNSLPQSSRDDNIYALGRIGPHNVVIACLPAGKTGTVNAAGVAANLRFTFISLRFGLMVGVGGGVPSSIHNIRLGDVVISKPDKTSGGVVQYDFGKTKQEGRFERTGSLNSPPQVLLNAVSNLQAEHDLEDSKVPIYLKDMVSKYPKLGKRATYRGSSEDRLFEPNYDHPCQELTCDKCDLSRLERREERTGDDPEFHYGLIASGNQVMRYGSLRETLRKELGILCFEMEAAGLMDNFPCLVIRGISNYADSHKNEIWQPYAAATAAAYAKELLYIIPENQVLQTPVDTSSE